jgi:ubiquinone/menaquinone biosynthesis C-methylase UbiE
MNNNNPEKLVRESYNKIAAVYHKQRDKFRNDKVLNSFASLLSSGAEVLDVGCGAGVPVAQFLVKADFNVTGVDFSSSMIELAQVNVPKATFIEMDMRQLEFDDGSFDGITAFYSLFHIQKEDHGAILLKFHSLLRENGVLLFCAGWNQWEGTKDFHGAQMYWSQPGKEVTRQLVIDAGFDLILSEVRDYGGDKHYWVMARKTHNPRST